MEFKCKLREKTFKDKEGIERKYNALVFTLADESELEIPVKSDKVKLLKLSEAVNKGSDMPELKW